MSAPRGLTAFLAAMAITAALTVAAPAAAHADWELDLWVLLLIREGDPDTPDLVVKGPGGDNVVVDPNGYTQDEFMDRFEELLDSILAALN